MILLHLCFYFYFLTSSISYSGVTLKRVLEIVGKHFDLCLFFKNIQKKLILFTDCSKRVNLDFSWYFIILFLLLFEILEYHQD